MSLQLAGGIDDRPAIAEQIANISLGTAMPPGDWAAMRAALDAEGTVDFRGASGEVTFDANGDIRGPFFITVWTISSGAVTVLRIERSDPAS
jgi:branched-chain amino acid transport system substrate-binding protein